MVVEMRNSIEELAAKWEDISWKMERKDKEMQIKRDHIRALKARKSRSKI